MDIKNLTTKELRELALKIREELLSRIKEEKQVINIIDEALDENYYVFDFECKYGRKEKRPYVAVLYGNKNLNWKFFELVEFWDDDGGIVKGECKIKEGKVFEVNDNKNRKMYLVDNLQPVYLGDGDKAATKAAVFSYVRGDISKQQLYELLGLSEVKINIPEVLKEDD